MSTPEHDAASRRTFVVLAIVTLFAFGAATTLLGLGAAKAARPCPRPWAYVLVAGPGVVTALAAGATAFAAAQERRRPWLPSVVGCLAMIAVVFCASAAVHVV